MCSFKARAVIFDLDGVLVDTEPLFLKALNQVLLSEGFRPLTIKENETLIGTTVEYTWRSIMYMRSLPHSITYYLDQYDRIVPHILETELVVQPGVTRVIETVQTRGLPLGLASGSLRKWVDLKLGVAGLDQVFNVTIAGDEIQCGKPAPDIYLEAATRLAIPPSDCLAIEDSPAGVAAGVAAGMYTVAVRTDTTAKLDVSHANVIIESLEDFDIDLLWDANILTNNRST